MDDTRELILELINHARAGVHTKIEQLRFFREYVAARITSSATTKVINVLGLAADNIFNTYCNAVECQQADVNMLLAYKQLQQAVNFYKEELCMIKAVLKDYENYLWDGNFLRAVLFGEERDL
jgi:hypothetical protein